MLNEFLLNALWHAVTFIGLVYLVGFIISLINRYFYKVTGYSKLAVYGTGLIGTPIHELSHHVMCLVFFHKVHDVKFFQINDDDGVLGYVSHSWNSKNLYQQIGNYFIGIAPIAVGTLIIFFAMKYFLPLTYSDVNGYFEAIQVLGSKVSIFDYVFDMFGGMLSAMFLEFSTGWKWWVFMLLSICVALHMTLSTADLKGSYVAIPLLLLLILGANLVIGFLFGGVYNDFLVIMNSAGGFVVCMLMLSLVLSALCLFFTIILKGAFWLIRKIFRR